MKRILILAAAVLAAVACGQKSQTSKALILYYSQTATTRAVAEEIQKLTGADIEEIALVNPYDGTYQETIERGSREVAEGVLPELQPLKANLAEYDVIFLGYPVWFGTYANPIGTLLATVDLSGKKIIPFCTFGSGSLEASAAAIAAKLPKSEVLPAYGVRAARIDAMPQEVETFLKQLGCIPGEVAPLADFPAPHAVSEEEAAIFDVAVADYPMISAVAREVASRAVPGGTEYCFKAVNKPREGREIAPNAPTQTIYVIAMDGQAPIFTRVVR